MCCCRVAFSWTPLLCVVEVVSNPQPLHEVGTGVLCVLTGTHPPPRQYGEPSERQLVLACLLCAVVVVVVTDCGS